MRNRVTDEEISAKLKRRLTVSIDQGADNGAYSALVDEAFREAIANERGARADKDEKRRVQVAPVVAKLVDKLTPRELARLVLHDDVEAFARVTGFEPKRAAEYMRWLMADGSIFAIEMVEIGDAVKMELRGDDDEPIPTSELSDGQQTCAILPLVLLQGTHPILIDQPEDNVHGKFRSSTVIQALLEVKAVRQVILATHDANLVVLPLPRRVVVLGAKNRKGFLLLSGTLEETKAWIEEWLDGGSSAFLTRKTLYGH